MKEAAARIKINKLLEASGWRFFANADGPANIQLEPSVHLKSDDLTTLGENFEKTTKGFIDFLLLNDKGFPFIVLEAKAEDKNPLIGKEQARKYAKSQNCRFVILSNGNLHYFWDLERGNLCRSIDLVRFAFQFPQNRYSKRSSVILPEYRNSRRGWKMHAQISPKS
jgi:type I restriction enzyme R subunit